MKILELSGVKSLNKNEQKVINGGSGVVGCQYGLDYSCLTICLKQGKGSACYSGLCCNSGDV